MASELVHGHNWKNISKRSILKIDLKKIFDSLSWNFVLFILRALNFRIFLSVLLSNVYLLPDLQLQLMVNWVDILGAQEIFVKATLSPYLFVFAMEVFGKLLNK